MVQQPVVKAGGTAYIKGGCEQQKRSSRQKRQENADDAECQRKCTEQNIKDFHVAKIHKKMNNKIVWDCLLFICTGKYVFCLQPESLWTSGSRAVS